MSQVKFMWLKKKSIYRDMRNIVGRWPINDTSGIEKTGLILYEVWLARQGLQPYPQVGVLIKDDVTLGVLCGHQSALEKHFHIQHMVIVNDLTSTNESVELAEQLLLEAAMDFSQTAGFFGRVSCVPDEHEKPMWRRLGFTLGDDRQTHRRLGYFARLS